MNIGPDEEDLRANQGPEDEQLGRDSDEGVDEPIEEADDGLAEDGDDQGERDALGEDDGKAGQGPAEVAPKGRAARDYGRLRAEAREAKEKADRLEREVADIRLRTQTPTVDQVKVRRDAELENARLLGGENYYETLRRHDREDFNQQLGNIQFQVADSTDRSTFAGLCARNPAISAIEDRVEAELANLRRSGGNAPRETVAKFILGDMAIRRAPAAKGRAQKRADVDNAREKARPTRSGGDVARTPSRGGDDKTSRANRLKDLNI